MRSTETFLIVGLGSIGKRHLACLRSIEPEARIVVWRQFHQDSTTVPNGADHIVVDLESALSFTPTYAIIANPASEHVKTALKLTEAGIHLLVEKPLSHNMDHVDALISICAEKGLVLMVGYVLRFNRSLRAFREHIKSGQMGRIVSFRAEVGQYLPKWRPGSDYHAGVSAQKALGGGALLELSHELDYVRWIFGEVKTVSGAVRNSGLLDIDVEDIVELILEFESSDGASVLGSVHLDMLQRAPCRTCRVVGEHGVLEWDGLAHRVRYFDGGSGAWDILFDGQAIERNDMFIEQLRNFIHAVRANCQPMVSGQDGKAVMEVVQAARQAARLNRKVVLR